jgi:hypothetical protein
MESRAGVGETDGETMYDDCIICLDEPLLFSVESVHGVRDDVFKVDDENGEARTWKARVLTPSFSSSKASKAMGRKIVAQEEHLLLSYLLSPEVNTPGMSEGDVMKGRDIAVRKP